MQIPGGCTDVSWFGHRPDPSFSKFIEQGNVGIAGRATGLQNSPKAQRDSNGERARSFHEEINHLNTEISGRRLQLVEERYSLQLAEAASYIKGSLPSPSLDTEKGTNNGHWLPKFVRALTLLTSPAVAIPARPAYFFQGGSLHTRGACALTACQYRDVFPSPIGRRSADMIVMLAHDAWCKWFDNGVSSWNRLVGNAIAQYRPENPNAAPRLATQHLWQQYFHADVTPDTISDAAVCRLPCGAFIGYSDPRADWKRTMIICGSSRLHLLNVVFCEDSL